MEKDTISKEEMCSTTSTTTSTTTAKTVSATTTTTKYGLVELESLFIDGEPDPLLVDVPKLFFIEVLNSYN